MKNIKETLSILKCHKTNISKHVKADRLILECKVGKTKYFTDESVESTRIFCEEHRFRNLPKHLKELYVNEKGTIEINQAKKIEKKIEKKIKENSSSDITEGFKLNSIGNDIMSSTIDELKSLGLYRENDNYAIFDYAMFYQLGMFQAMQASNESVYTDSKGIQRISPTVVLSIAFSKTIDTKRAALGLTPVARSKMTLNESKDLDGMAELMSS